MHTLQNEVYTIGKKSLIETWQFCWQKPIGPGIEIFCDRSGENKQGHEYFGLHSETHVLPIKPLKNVILNTVHVKGVAYQSGLRPGNRIIRPGTRLIEV